MNSPERQTTCVVAVVPAKGKGLSRPLSSYSPKPPGRVWKTWEVICQIRRSAKNTHPPPPPSSSNEPCAYSIKATAQRGLWPTSAHRRSSNSPPDRYEKEHLLKKVRPSGRKELKNEVWETDPQKAHSREAASHSRLQVRISLLYIKFPSWTGNLDVITYKTTRRIRSERTEITEWTAPLFH